MNKKTMKFGRVPVTNVRRFPMWKGLSADEIARDIKTARPIAARRGRGILIRSQMTRPMPHPFGGLDKSPKRGDTSRALRAIKKAERAEAGVIPWRRPRKGNRS